MNARFSLGIDLGTSNSAIAVADLESGETQIIKIAQVLGPNQLGDMPTLPSAIYIPHYEEFPEGSFPLPWNDGKERAIVGQFARDRGALVPDRLVTSAKSWLSNPPSIRNSEAYPGDRISRKKSSRLSNAHAVTCSI
jgi:molecular chaperone DnaK (HSP70)